MMKKNLIALAAVGLIIAGAGKAQAQTYNQTGSDRQSASADVGMYQLTLQAFRASDYFNRPNIEQAKHVKWSVQKIILAAGIPVLAMQSGQIIPYQAQGDWYLIPEGAATLISSGQIMGNAKHMTPSQLRRDVSATQASVAILEVFYDTSNVNRALYLSLAEIAQKSFPTIRSQKMNRQQAVAFLSKQIDANLPGIFSSKYQQFSNIVMTSTAPGVDAQTREAYCVTRTNNFPCSPAQGYDVPAGLKVVENGFNDWTATFADGVVMRNNYGQVDVSQNGRAIFSEYGIKGEKLSIGGSSDRGSSTSQKRGD